ncbi:hypothetical protein DIS24_g6533 [Lasiodiplodia hormozganensis]|uniref:Uncharacterized protein n=1 Tax=Lasiodiplodia hormozganensis TaxID=869390 RepID=A0AA39YDH4_9PEZI|nr:hypothetical protein DIS24_g6533 [Lasiodiplodia hormozganensis]
MPGDQSETYSTLEIDETSSLPVATPKITSPEIANAGGKEVANEELTDETRRSTICGIRRMTFWILVIIASLALIGVAVGIGVGVTQQTKSESDQQSPQQVLNQRGVASTSRLAAANYTDAYGVDHSQVFYQDSSLEIWMSDWNSGSKNWNPFPVSDNDSTSAISPKNGTPISANNWMLDYSANVNSARVYTNALQPD